MHPVPDSTAALSYGLAQCFGRYSREDDDDDFASGRTTLASSAFVGARCPIDSSASKITQQTIATLPNSTLPEREHR